MQYLKNNKLIFKMLFIIIPLFTVSAHADNSIEDLFEDIGEFSVKSIEVPNNTNMQALNDSDMKDVTGQALFDISQRTGSDGLQFIRFLMNAKVETNLNIERLSLGPEGNEDILMNNLRLSGSGLGPEDYASLTRPFLELAIDNFDDEQTKRLIGVRFGAEELTGLLSVGEKDVSTACLNGTTTCADTGIERFHGSLSVADFNLTADVAPVDVQNYFDQRVNNGNGNGTFQYTYPAGYSGLSPTVTALQYFYPNNFSGGYNPSNTTQYNNHLNNNQIYTTQLGGLAHPEPGNVDRTLENQIYLDFTGLAVFVGSDNWYYAGVNFLDEDDNNVLLTIPQINTVASGFNVYTDNGPVSAYPVQTTIDVPNITLTDTPSAKVFTRAADGDDVDTDVSLLLTGVIEGFTADAVVTEPLTYFHNIPLNSGAALSIQSQTVRWPGASRDAQAGYWLGVEGEVDLGSISLLSDIYLSPENYRQVEVGVERFLAGTETVQAEISAGALFVPVPVNIGTVNANSVLTVSDQNVPVGLSQQEFNNCYGGIDCF